MTNTFFEDQTSIEAQAVFLGQRMQLKTLEQTERISISPLIMRAGQSGLAVLFRYGAVVFFGVNGIEQAAFIRDLEPFLIEPVNNRENESCTLKREEDRTEGTDPHYINLKTWDVERFQLVAEILAKSVVLSYYESRISETFDRLDPVAADLQTGKVSKGKNTRELLKHMGYSLSIHRKMIGHVEIEGKPELLWDRPDLERLYVRLEEEYEISERHTTLKNKLDLIHSTAETMLGLLQERRTLHVEWYIVFLILFDIIWGMAEKFLHF